MSFETLPGFRAFYPENAARRAAIFEPWRAAARSFNFQEYDAPVLEPLELYIEKSGEEIVGQLFHFEDRGGRTVALRPEMTPSLARLVGAKANSLKRPIKWFNIGEHYRYERPQKGRLRAFCQFNADILGEGSAAADAELMSLLVHTLKGFGLDASDFKLRLSDRDLWLFLLQAEGLDRVTSAEVLGIIDKIERTSREKSVEQLTEVLGDSASAFMAKVEGLVGIREFSKLESYFAGLAEESSQAEAIEARLEEWRFLLKALESSGAAEFVEIDLGIVRGLAYYTGFVFEAFEASGEGRALAGGGRYDDLVGKLGSQPMPAVGFAMGDVTLGDLLEKKGLLEEAECGPDFIFIIGGEAERAQALGDAAVLRSAGYSVEYPLKDLAFGKQFKAANQRGARFAIIYGSDELEAGVLKVRDLGAGKETNYPREDLVRLAESLFEEGSK